MNRLISSAIAAGIIVGGTAVATSREEAPLLIGTTDMEILRPDTLGAKKVGKVSVKSQIKEKTEVDASQLSPESVPQPTSTTVTSESHTFAAALVTTEAESTLVNAAVTEIVNSKLSDYGLHLITYALKSNNEPLATVIVSADGVCASQFSFDPNANNSAEVRQAMSFSGTVADITDPDKVNGPGMYNSNGIPFTHAEGPNQRVAFITPGNQTSINVALSEMAEIHKSGCYIFYQAQNRAQ